MHFLRCSKSDFSLKQTCIFSKCLILSFVVDVMNMPPNVHPRQYYPEAMVQPVPQSMEKSVRYFTVVNMAGSEN